jgi:hypothetical protein
MCHSSNELNSLADGNSGHILSSLKMSSRKIDGNNFDGDGIISSWNSVEARQ